jgi:hypothetical protein
MLHKLQETMIQESERIELYRLMIDLLLHDGLSLSSPAIIELSNQLDEHGISLMRAKELISKVNKKTVDMDSIQHIKTITACV